MRMFCRVQVAMHRQPASRARERSVVRRVQRAASAARLGRICSSPRDSTHLPWLGLVRQSREQQSVRDGGHRLVRPGAQSLGLAVSLKGR